MLWYTCVLLVLITTQTLRRSSLNFRKFFWNSTVHNVQFHIFYLRNLTGEIWWKMIATSIISQWGWLYDSLIIVLLTFLENGGNIFSVYYFSNSFDIRRKSILQWQCLELNITGNSTEFKPCKSSGTSSCKMLR